ncbi:MAG: cysteine desulfurase NifS [Planctomycetaceae bacterium]|nr:cysteine desulfurase NifS [Planctomycetaceae bacterium]
MIYLDNNATTQPADPVIDAVADTMRSTWANPSSVHRFGQEARRRVELARTSVSRLIGCRERELIFTSGATEANNLALRGIAATRKSRRLIITLATEHSAIREPCERLAAEDYEIHHAPIDSHGVADLDALTALLDQRADDIALLTIHWANNETGVIQPIEQIGPLCRTRRVPLHTDATQAVGKLPVDVAAAQVDALSLSGHKMHGPKGVGALYLRAAQRLRPQSLGGPQERKRRGGTEAVPGIVGMGVVADLAVDLIRSDTPAHIAQLRDRFESAVQATVPDAVINGAAAPRLWNTTNIGFPSLEAEALLVLLSEREVCASAGAACSSGSLDPSPVLLAMGIDEPIAHGSVRFSLSRFTTDQDIDRAAEIIPEVIDKLRGSMVST